MRQRVIELLAVIAVTTVAALAMSVAGQTTTSAQSGQALKTSWGEPDLQGLWTRQYDVPMQRPGQPEEVAPAYVFFASNADSSYITGEVLTLLGGETSAG